MQAPFSVRAGRVLVLCLVAGAGAPLVTSALAASQGARESPAAGSDSAVSAPDKSPRDLRVALALPFVENRGQLGGELRFYAPTCGAMLGVTAAGELVFSAPASDGGDGLVLREHLVGARSVPPRGLVPAATRVNVYAGSDPKRWRTGLASFEALDLGEVYPGIELELWSRSGRVEKLFRVAPFADPDAIRIAVDGVEGLRVAPDGRLEVEARRGPVRWSRPVAYQLVQGVRREVEAAYCLAGNVYGFELGPYDESLELVIDPILQSTYLGGSGGESVAALVVDALTDKVFVAGGTTSSAFGLPDLLTSGDAYVARLSGDLATLEVVTFLAAPGGETVLEVEVQPAGSPVAGHLVLMGQTDDGAGFPDLPTARFGANMGNIDVFLARVEPVNLTIVQASLLGGSFNDRPSALAIDPGSFNVYVAGDTNSGDFAGFAALGGAQPTISGVRDAFVAGLSADLATLSSGTFLGAMNGSESDNLIAAGGAGVYLYGLTNSSDFDATLGALSPAGTGGGLTDAYFAVLSADLSSITAVRRLGGSDIEDNTRSSVLVIPGTNEVYVAGDTDSAAGFPGAGMPPGGFLARASADLTAIDTFTVPGTSVRDFVREPVSGDIYMAGTTGNILPGTSGALQETYGGGLRDAFVARLTGDLMTLQRATYVGGDMGESLHALVIDPGTTDVYVAGSTGSTVFPNTGGGAQESSGGLQDGFAARLSADLTTGQVTFLGGSDNDTAVAVALDTTTQDVYLAGFTSSGDFPGTAGGAQPDIVTEPDAFVTRFDDSLAEGADISVAALDLGPVVIGGSLTGMLVIENVGVSPLDVTDLSLNDNSGFFSLDAGAGTCGAPPFSVAAGSSCTVQVGYDPTAAGLHSAAVMIVSNDSDEGSLVVAVSGRSNEDLGREIEVTPPRVEFSGVSVGSRSVTLRSITITNRGTEDLMILGVNNGDPSNFLVDLSLGGPPCGAIYPRTLALGESCSIFVEFTPQVEGTIEGLFTIQSDDPDDGEDLVQVVLAGIGLAGDGGGSGWCFIATAAYGSPLHEDVALLRAFRDHFLMTNVLGRSLVALYYRLSPPAADYIRERPWARRLARRVLTPLVHAVEPLVVSEGVLSDVGARRAAP